MLHPTSRHRALRWLEARIEDVKDTAIDPGGPGAFRRRTALLGIGVVAVLAAGRWEPEAPVPVPAPEVRMPEPPVALPVQMNERVEKWMRRFMTDQKPMFERYLARESLYGAYIRRELRRRDMPEDLIYLAMIESGFYDRATSRVSAVGMWQFMGPTAQAYGLRVDAWVDERRDPFKATDAALDYLQRLYDRFDSWYLAAAAYNAGPGRVNRALRRHGGGRTGDESVYWDIIDHLPRETREYVPKLLAASTLARHAQRYGFEVTPVDGYAYDRVWVPGGTPLRVVAAALEVETGLVRDLNPQLVRGVTPPGEPYGLRVPVGTSGRVVASLGRRGGSLRADD